MKKIILLSVFVAFTAIANAQVTSLSEDFGTCDSTSGGEHPTGWTAYSAVGDQNWTCYSTFGVTFGTPCIQINGYFGGNFANEDWLITPRLDMSSYTNPFFNFYARYKFPGDSLHVMYSTNYSGTGNPSASGVTWTELSKNNTFVNDTNWTLFSCGVNAIKATPFYVAFKYTSTNSDGSRWTIDSVHTSLFPTSVEDVNSKNMPVTVIGEAGNGNISLSFTTFEAGEFTVNVNDMTGRKVYSQTVQANAGNNSVRLNDVNISSGIYIVEVRNAHTFGLTKVSIK